MEKNLNSSINCDSMEVVIKPPLEKFTSVVDNISHMQTFAKNSVIVEKSILKKDFYYIQKITKPTSKSNVNDSIIDFQYGKILLSPKTVTTPYEIFEEVSCFERFLKEIVISQTLLYSQQKSDVFDIGLDELEAFFWYDCGYGIPCFAFS